MHKLFEHYPSSSPSPPLALAIATLITCLAVPLFSHSKLVTPAPRTSSDPSTQNTLDGGGLNFSFPCGPMDLIPPGAPTTTWMAGEDYTVTFDHIVDHGGETIQFLVSYDGGMTFDDLGAPSLPLGGTTSYVTGGIAAPPGTGLANIRIKAPNIAAASIILRFTDGTYFSCADITIAGPSGGGIFADGFETGDLAAWE